MVSAPSGGGKSTLIKLLRERRGDVDLSVSHTTRAPRGAERDGVEYRFVDDTAFDRLVAQGEMAEWAQVYGHRYGTSRAEIQRIRGGGRHVLLDIDVQGGMSIMRAFPDAVSVFVLPPDLRVLEQRLRGRGTDSPEAVARRLSVAREEVGWARHYGHVIVNEVLEAALADLLAVIRAAELRTERMTGAIDALAAMG
ncbi:MAG: guanylate kinase [Myxococcales bacterium]